MSSKYNFSGVFLQGVFILLVSFLLQSCVKQEINDISDNVMLKQSFSVPLGLKEMAIEAPSVNDTSSIKGTYGRYYYNGFPYASQVPIFQPMYEEVSLDLSANAKLEWIKRLTFNIVIENDYPSIGILEVYLVDENGVVLDQIFGKQGLVVSEAKVDSKGNLTSSSQKIEPVVYEGARLELLKKTKSLIYQASIQSIFFSPVHLFDSNKFKVNIGAKA
jgi:hypothetical protein